jgi:hypothetical protein
VKHLLSIIVLAITTVGFSNTYCLEQELLGFEQATFIKGAELNNEQPQVVIDELLSFAGVTLVQVDTFTTMHTFYELLRVKETNGLILMTVNEQHVCFYQVPTQAAPPVSQQTS